MFSNVRVNQQIFVLDKANGIFEVGTVCEEPKTRFVTQPQNQNPQFNSPFPQQMTVQVVDLKINTPNGQRTLMGLPMDKNFFDNDAKTLFCTEDKDLMLNEFKILKNQSEAHIKQTQYHQDMIGKYGSWIDMLDPEAAEKKRLATELNEMKAAYAQQAEINQKVMEQLQALSKQNEILLAQRSEGVSKPAKTKENV